MKTPLVVWVLLGIDDVNGAGVEGVYLDHADAERERDELLAAAEFPNERYTILRHIVYPKVR
jgi:hypothetical protein